MSCCGTLQTPHQHHDWSLIDFKLAASSFDQKTLESETSQQILDSNCFFASCSLILRSYPHAPLVNNCNACIADAMQHHGPEFDRTFCNSMFALLEPTIF